MKTSYRFKQFALTFGLYCIVFLLGGLLPTDWRTDFLWISAMAFICSTICWFIWWVLTPPKKK